MDIALAPAPDAAGFDIVCADGDLVLDGTLATAAIISVFTDRRARDDDALPHGQTDRRGWWGDSLLSEELAGDRIGSRRWLVWPAKQTESTRRRMEDIDRESFDWMVQAGIADDVRVSGAWTGRGLLSQTITASKGGSVIMSRVWEASFDAF